MTHTLHTARTLEELFDYERAPAHSPTLLARHIRARSALLREAIPGHDDALFDLLDHHTDRALEYMERGHLGQGIALSSPSRYAEGEDLVLDGRRVTMKHMLPVSDTLHRAHCEVEGVDGEAHMIWSSSALDDEKIARASQALSTMFSDDAPQHKHLPRLLRSGRTEAGHMAMVIDARELPTLAETLATHPTLGHPEHMVWILRRTLSALGWAHKNGIVHGNICPETLRLSTSDHNVVIHDWEHASIEPARTGQGFLHTNPEFSPPEVAQRKPPLPSSDLYALGRTMQWLLRGGTSDGPLPERCPDELSYVLRFMTLQSPVGRARDAWQLYHEVERIRRHLYGAHKFKKVE